jgi:hypothetical protein
MISATTADLGTKIDAVGVLTRELYITFGRKGELEGYTKSDP